ncbi:MAG: LD-carboxypeptidase, partial [Schleiferiaceae bacterium]|nr:LD-carboxypeptidase [Schleiferiaceae bacterium]
MQNVIPQKLYPGATIALCSTARKITKNELQPAINYLEKNGLKVQLGKTIGTAVDQFSGTETQRLDDLQELLNDDNIRAILFARGGYGTVQLLDGIIWDNFNNKPKWLIGYSDLTALLMDSFSKTNTCSIHGPMPINFNTNTPKAWENLVSLLLRGKKSDLFWNGSVQDIPGVATGQLVGGNLSVIYSLLGSNSLPDM